MKKRYLCTDRWMSDACVLVNYAKREEEGRKRKEEIEIEKEKKR